MSVVYGDTMRLQVQRFKEEELFAFEEECVWSLTSQQGVESILARWIDHPRIPTVARLTCVFTTGIEWRYSSMWMMEFF
jgi:hypothetical protein